MQVIKRGHFIPEPWFARTSVEEAKGNMFSSIFKNSEHAPIQVEK